MERNGANPQGISKISNRDSANVESGMPRPLERGQERLRLVGESPVRPVIGAANRQPGPVKQGPSTTSGSRRRKRRVTARFYRVVIGALTVVLLFSYGIAFWRLAMVERDIRAVHNQIAAAEKRNDQLRKDLAKSSSDAFVEEAAREDLGLVKPGETAWVVVTPEDPKSPFKVEKRSNQGAVADAEGW